MQISDVAFLPMSKKHIKLASISLRPARLCAFWIEEVGQVLTAAACMCNIHLQIHNEKYQKAAHLQLPVLSILASLIVLPEILLLAPFMLSRTSFLPF